MPDADTYPMPKHGWTCFHCGENFKKPGAAADHFGEKPGEKPACIMFDEVGTRGVVMTLRRAVSKVRRQEIKIENLEYCLNGSAQDYQRITGLRAAHETRMEIDSLEGRAITGEAIIEDISKRWPALVEASRRRVCQVPSPDKTPMPAASKGEKE